jgi:Protein phosphatase 2C
MRVADDLLSVLENASIWTEMGAKDKENFSDPVDSKKTDASCLQGSDVSRSSQLAHSNSNSGLSVKERLDSIVMKALKEAFLKTDNDFLTKSKHPQHGSTATIALILGNHHLILK